MEDIMAENTLATTEPSTPQRIPGKTSETIAFFNDRVAAGFEPFAEAGDNENAMSIGYQPSAQAGEGGYLIFVDTAGSAPAVAIFKVDPDKGIWPNIPYCWQAGWVTPRPDDDRIANG
jgi:hypothetical protein